MPKATSNPIFDNLILAIGNTTFPKKVTLYFSKLVFKAKVIEVIDGDTFKGEVDLGFDVTITRHFRVFGIDTLEIFKPKTDSERVRGPGKRQSLRTSSG
ncbi:MAG: hypothetical protein IPG24_13375 [Leptospiraceae bacterium]|nr:hypothetical protein [Leptospiraceae bacterium]